MVALADRLLGAGSSPPSWQRCSSGWSYSAGTGRRRGVAPHRRSLDQVRSATSRAISRPEPVPTSGPGLPRPGPTMVDFSLGVPESLAGRTTSVCRLTGVVSMEWGSGESNSSRPVRRHDLLGLREGVWARSHPPRSTAATRLGSLTPTRSSTPTGTELSGAPRRGSLDRASFGSA